MYYYGARYYNPLIGRFLTPDSVVQNPGGNPQTLNRYAYALKITGLKMNPDTATKDGNPMAPQ